MVPALSAIMALGNAAAWPLAPIRRVVAIWKRSELSGHVTGSVCCTAWQAHRASRSQWMLWESSESNLHQTTRVSIIRFVDQLSATASPGVGQLAEKTLECRGIQSDQTGLSASRELIDGLPGQSKRHFSLLQVG